MKKRHDKRLAQRATTPRPFDGAAALRALNDAEEHLASQPAIPDALRPALLQAEANCRGNAGNVAPAASIDGRLLVKIPDDCNKQALFRFLWDALARSGGHSIQFAFAAQDDTLRVIYMDRDCVGYAASAPIKSADGGIRLGDWEIERMPLQSPRTPDPESQSSSSGAGQETRDDVGKEQADGTDRTETDGTRVHNQERRRAMSRERLGEELLESAEQEQLYRRLTEVAYGNSCPQVFAAALRLACVAGLGVADGVAEAHQGCRPEPVRDAFRGLLGNAIRNVLAGLERVAEEGKLPPVIGFSVQDPFQVDRQPAGSYGTSEGEGQADREQIRVLRDRMLAGVMDESRRLLYHAALWIAADCYTSVAVMAGMLQREERQAAMQKICGDMLKVNERWRLELEQRNKNKGTLE